MNSITSYKGQWKVSNIIQLNKYRPEPLFLLYSDNFDGEIVTASALKEIQLQMSTGDWHTHTAVPIDCEPAMELLAMREISGPISLEDLND